MFYSINNIFRDLFSNRFSSFEVSFCFFVASIDLEDELKSTPFDYAKQKNLNYCLLVMLSHLKYRHKRQTTPQPPSRPPSDEPKITERKKHPDARPKTPVVEKRKILQKQNRESEPEKNVRLLSVNKNV